ncbi:hypothetical protein PGTUg99_019014 [Puccinia graminis f. sp. tritici]|uniref:Uncharacterized protein n=1 Tax=Puccinia graminis f. sp. tritici TaxID=56615 RepID=A0A5B0QGX1_PUCGR|nr:hypothetical protein PGTUg99_019014 [Puccinia graminis f. sp. tritici]
MKASLPCTLLLLFTAMLAYEASIPWLRNSSSRSRVTDLESLLPKQCKVRPLDPDGPETTRSIHIRRDTGLEFHPFRHNWMVRNYLGCDVTMEIRFPNHDGRPLSVVRTVGRYSDLELNIPKAKELEVDVHSVGEMFD